jgi:hypothetical protein
VLHLVTFAIAAVSLRKLLNSTGFNGHLRRRDAFLHLLLYL